MYGRIQRFASWALLEENRAEITIRRLHEFRI